MDKDKITEIIDGAKYQLELITHNYVKIISKSLICDGNISTYRNMYQEMGKAEENEKRIKEEIGKKVSENVKLDTHKLSGDFIDYGMMTQVIEGSVCIIPEPSIFFDKLNYLEDALNKIQERLDSENETNITEDSHE